VAPTDGVEVKIIAGRVGDAVGPVKDLVVNVEYLDVTMRPRREFRRPIAPSFNSFAYVLEGEASFGDEGAEVGAKNVAVFGKGDEVVARTNDEGARFILVSGSPIGEPAAWRGPIVMNTEEELRAAFQEIRSGTFVRAGRSG